MKSLILVAVALFCILEAASAIRCYNCIYSDDANCGKDCKNPKDSLLSNELGQMSYDPGSATASCSYNRLAGPSVTGNAVLQTPVSRVQPNNNASTLATYYPYCVKASGSFQGYSGVLRSYVYYPDPNLDGTTTTLYLDGYTPIQASLCNKNKCNSAGSLQAGMMVMLTATVAFIASKIL